MLYEQAKQINKLVETYSGLKKIELPSKEIEQPSKEIKQPSKEIKQPSKEIEQPSKEIKQPSKEIKQPSTQKSSSLIRTTTTQIAPTEAATTQIQKYKLKLTRYTMRWGEARQHCADNYNGDLIQHDPRLYTRQGRQEIADSLNMPYTNYHTR